ncbi:polysaccharide deacetylase family protein [Haliea sp.]
MKQFILALARLTGLFALSKLLTADRVRILAYHGTWLGEGHFGNFLYMSAGKFQRRMELLKTLGYPVISLTDALAKLGSEELPKGTTVITIDDGWYSTYLHMLPVLQAHGYPATIYLTTYYCYNQAPVIDVALQYCFHQIDPDLCPLVHIPEYGLGPLPTGTGVERSLALAAASEVSAELDSDATRQRFLQSVCHQTAANYDLLSAERWFHLMTPAEIKDAADKCMTVELHTHHHRITHRGEDCLKQELALNNECIKAITRRDPMHFCYPSGRFSPAVWPALSEAGIASATTTEIGLVDSESAIYALPRILDGQNVSELEFEAEMSGFMELIRKARKFSGLRG